MSLIQKYKDLKEKSEVTKKTFKDCLGGPEGFGRLEFVAHRHSGIPAKEIFVYWNNNGFGGARLVGGDVEHYLMKAMNDMMPQIMYKAMQLVESDVEKARVEARDEANAILDQTQ